MTAKIKQQQATTRILEQNHVYLNQDIAKIKTDTQLQRTKQETMQLDITTIQNVVDKTINDQKSAKIVVDSVKAETGLIKQKVDVVAGDVIVAKIITQQMKSNAELK